jgi:hypothetical protein
VDVFIKKKKEKKKETTKHEQTFICATKQSMTVTVPILTEHEIPQQHYEEIFYAECHPHQLRNTDSKGMNSVTPQNKMLMSLGRSSGNPDCLTTFCEEHPHRIS